MNEPPPVHGATSSGGRTLMDPPGDVGATVMPACGTVGPWMGGPGCASVAPIGADGGTQATAGPGADDRDRAAAESRLSALVRPAVLEYAEAAGGSGTAPPGAVVRLASKSPV